MRCTDTTRTRRAADPTCTQTSGLRTCSSFPARGRFFLGFVPQLSGKIDSDDEEEEEFEEEEEQKKKKKKEEDEDEEEEEEDEEKEAEGV